MKGYKSGGSPSQPFCKKKIDRGNLLQMDEGSPSHQILLGEIVKMRYGFRFMRQLLHIVLFFNNIIVS